jgi:hypothetical protein
MSRIRLLAVAVASAGLLTGCVSAPSSSQPDVDAAALATNPDFGAVLTTLDEGECLTTIRLAPGGTGVSANDVADAFDLLRDAADAAGCDPVVRIVTSDRDPVEVSHLPQYLDVEDVDGELHL